jgi:serine/threonine-protein kinase
MEFVSGKNLEQMLAQSPIPFASAAVWGAELASALAYAHRAGIIHGDVKPSNIRVTENDQVKLVDFGVARFASQVSGSDRVLGTPAYLSPEQIEGQKQDGRSDLFSLGVVLYEMITGVRPFAGNALGEVCAQILTADPILPSKRNPAVPAAFDRIIARCLAKNPEERYQSGNELARALYLVARAGDKLSVEPKRPYWFMRPAHPRDLLAIASAILLLVGAVSAADSLRDWIRTRSTPAIASVGPNSSKDAGFRTHAMSPSNPQIPRATEGVPQKPVRKSSTEKRSSTNSGPQAREAPLDPLLERSPLR